MEKQGKVWLVGAGPSDAGLMTLKGKAVLEQADVVVYDALVSASVLAMIPEQAQTVYVGKRSGHHSVPQPQINQILLEQAQQGKRVVRLKGGDPFLFGRGGEELELLREHNIPFEVVPGITSAIAVPAYNGIPVTHRDYCSSVHIITAHSKQDGELNIPFPALCQLHGTLVFLMGVTSMERICRGLLQAGMDAQTPAAILQEGTSAAQRRVVASLSTLVERAQQEKIQAPAVLVIGKVCQLADQLSWTQLRPLDKVRVILTRPKELVSRMADRLYQLGAQVIELPSISLQPYEENELLKTALEHLESYRWVAFTSIAGVRIFFEQLQKYRVDLRKLMHLLTRDYKTRNVLLLFFGYTVVLEFFAVVFGAAGVVFLGTGWFLAAGYFLARRIHGFERIVEALHRMRGGDMESRLTDMPEGVFAEMAEDINSLGDGMQAAVQNEIRAERMKTELITNVSHDLKTPLTSILSYSDLLCQMELTPEEANDYAKIIHQKGLRLKNLTSDLFDISKVRSGMEQMNCERLDAATLVRQALAEQEKAIQASGLALKVTLPEKELPIRADGRKMSRVLENLIGNCVKYSLHGTRVFISLAECDGQAVLEVKNTANYEMDFAPDEITERFVRGDAARSTEGSGLGLAIAKSYTEACGGAFEVTVDGDLFKVRISFPVYGL